MWELPIKQSGDSGQITVLMGKRGKTRHIVLKPETYTLLVNYRGNAPGDAYMFTSRTGKPLERSAR